MRQVRLEDRLSNWYKIALAFCVLICLSGMAFAEPQTSPRSTQVQQSQESSRTKARDSAHSSTDRMSLTAVQEGERLATVSEVLTTAQATIAACQLWVGNSQLFVSGVIVIGALISLALGVFALLFRRDVDQTRAMVQEVRDKASDMSDTFVKLNELKDKVADELRGFQEVNETYLRVVESTEALGAVLQLNHPSPDVVLKSLRKLSEWVRPEAAVSMMKILNDRERNETLRIEAAIGLGRYSEKEDLREFWPDILNSFKDSLDDRRLPPRVNVEVMKSIEKFLLELSSDGGRFDDNFVGGLRKTLADIMRSNSEEEVKTSATSLLKLLNSSRPNN